MPSWIITSLILSLVLTVALNVLPRLFPGAARRMEDGARRRIEESPPQDGSRVKVFFPWKWMIGLSIAGTVLLNFLANR